MSVTSEGLWDRYPLSPDSSHSDDDTHAREEIEQRLYSQLYHDSPNCEKDNGLCSYVKATSEVPSEGKPRIHDNTTTADSLKKSSKQFTKKLDVPAIVLSSSSTLSDDSEVQVIKEIVTVTQDNCGKEIFKPTDRSRANSKQIKKLKRPCTISNISLDSDDDVPVWSRLDSGTHSSDISLNVHMRTHGRQRHDSIISHTSSALGDDDDPLVTLPEQDEFDSLESVLDKLPDDGWNIISSDNPLVAKKARHLRYHSHKCHNCNQKGHMASSCPQPKKVRRCNLCGEIHKRMWERKYCPQAICGWCSQTGHSTDSCRDARSMRSIICQRCRARGHRAKACHELWRQWHATTQLQVGVVYPTVPQPPMRKAVVYCSNCSQRGHTASQCKVVAWNQMPILSPYVSHYNTFGELKDFGKFWSKHQDSQPSTDISSSRNRQSAEQSTSLPGDGAQGAATASHPRAKRKIGGKDIGKAAKKRKTGKGTAVIVDGGVSRKESRKEKKIRKKMAKRDGPLVWKSLGSSPGTSQTSDPKWGAKKHWDKKRKVRSSDNKQTADGSGFSQNAKKTKETKRKEKARNVHQVEVVERKRSMPDWQQLDGAMKSQPVRSWNEAF